MADDSYDPMDSGVEWQPERRRIDGKFHIEGRGIRLVHVSGVEVPEDEPLFLLRARDRNAIMALLSYEATCKGDGCTDYQMDGIRAAIEKFRRFKRDHPERVKQPGITRGAKEA